MAKQLHIKTSKELHGLKEVLFPSILCAMVHSGVPTTKLETLRVKYGADMTMSDYDGQTPLHVAASEGTLGPNILKIPRVPSCKNNIFSDFEVIFLKKLTFNTQN